MKKFIALFLSLAMATAVMSGCSSSSSTTTTESSTTTTETTTTESTTSNAVDATAATGDVEIGYIVSYLSSGIDDKGVGQMSWEAISAYGDANGHTYAYYSVADASEEAVVEAFEVAINNGAKVIFGGFQHSDAVGQLMFEYPDVCFNLTDASALGAYDVQDNAAATVFNTYECTFLAGYAAIKEGYTNIGIMSPYSISPVDQWVYGFVQGANYACAEFGIDNVSIQHYYLGNQDASPENQALAATWFETGIDLIFGNCGSAVSSVFAAAEASGGSVIAVDYDMAYLSDTIILSATKNYDVEITRCLTDLFENGTFTGGQVNYVGMETDSVGLAMDSCRMENFSQADYDALYDLLLNDVDGIRSSIVSSADTLEDMWDMVPDHYLTFTCIA